MNIVNKVAQSGLITLKPEDFKVDEVIGFDIKPLLWQGVVLREKDFRKALGELDLSPYTDRWVAVYCSEDTIIPTWAWMLVATTLGSHAKEISFGTIEVVTQLAWEKAMASFRPGDYQDARIVIKGCSDIQVPASVYLRLSVLLQPYVLSIMYGEPCSTVPVFKRPKQKDDDNTSAPNE
jgi:hypothetical protein